ncbi:MULTISPECIES: fumarylacetoacetate hydrolase family protein [Prauserella salsuginis group]|uniref:Fumarylacetoacetate hydrolase family protein n=1 Tax=Prauserella salsuginis TaxID=387889 RepID=A0ABW6G0Z4_9PSEU|nr:MULTISPECIES: fumarylacetoacetate hydrolase family protein [Prauserella salsuginis group]MCR3722000.1 5-carboxymethyl-2-hydroxymuconate isomerase [Prauserella flava]MCR3736006.1 5-carboxymethyl-2-hydroxymuconate isomerase [Prauserella salsuginis]
MRIGRLVDGRCVIDTGDGFWRSAAEGVTVESVVAGGHAETVGKPVDDPVFTAPYRPGTIIGVGLNFLDTVAQMGWEQPSAPYLFPKLSSSVIGDGDAIVLDDSLTARLDWEVELAVVIGRTTKNVSASEALKHVFGYTGANDVSARDVQAEDGQWLRGKGMDTYCPLGPVVVNADVIPDPQAVRLQTWVNGQQWQNGTTADMVFTVAELVAYCSAHFTLEPGDVILTGTPAGCGDFAVPRRGLRQGDVVETQVAGIGRLRNPVRAI